VSDGFRPVFVPAKPMGNRVSSYQTPGQLQDTKRRFLRSLTLVTLATVVLIHGLW